jgi:hypothetical protein
MKLIYLLIPAIFLAGCNSSNLVIFQKDGKSICNSEPEWVINPPVDKKAIYGIGIAPLHFKGEQAQRKSAISKAIDEIASQMNTTVNSQLLTNTTLKNGNTNHVMSQI